MTDRAALFDRIRKLRALAADKAATPAEAAAAAAAVERIIARHQLDEIGEERAQEPDVFVEERVYTWSIRKKPPQWHAKLAADLALAYQCAIFVAYREGVLYIVGRAQDIALVREQFDFLRREVEHLARRRSTRGRRDGSRFRVGVVEGIADAMRAARAQTLGAEGQAALHVRFMLACWHLERMHPRAGVAVLAPKAAATASFAAGRAQGGTAPVPGAVRRLGQ